MLKDRFKEIQKLRNKLCLIPVNGVTKDIIYTFNNTYNINSINIGFELSKVLKNEDLGKNLPIIAVESFRKIIEGSTSVYLDQETIVLYNLGILFEDDLNLNLESILLEISKNIVVILLWEGEISKQGLHFLSIKHGKLLELTEKHYLQLEI